MRLPEFNKRLAMFAICFLVSANALAREPIKIDAADAKQFIGEWVEVSFTVQSVGGNSAGYQELYSKADWSDPNNLIVRLPVNLVDAVKQWGGPSDLRKPFLKQVVSVTGHLALLEFSDVPDKEWPVIYIEDIHSLKRVGRTSPSRPTAEYQLNELEGFAVYLAPDAVASEKRKQHTVDILRRELAKIGRLTAMPAKDRLREIKIFVVPPGFGRAAAYYDPLLVRNDLISGGENPDFAGSVVLESGNAFDELLTKQPGLLLHELAHGYFDRMGGWANSALNEAYKNAIEQKLYDEVDHITRGPVEGYAKTNVDEYFAELSESWLLKNDYYPYSASELKRHDPVGMAAIKAFWSCLVPPNCK